MSLLLRRSATMRARRHPWTLAVLWGWQSVLAVAGGWPAASFVRTTYGAGPRNDAPLWDAGGHALLDFLWHGARGLAPITTDVEITLAAAATIGLVPTAGSMIAIAYSGPNHRAVGFIRTVGGAARAMPPLLWLLVVVGLGQAAALGAGALVAAAARAWFCDGWGEERADRAAVAIGLVFVIVASGIGVMHDLARAVVVVSRARGPRALAVAARIFGRAPLQLWWSWAWRALTSLAPVLAAAAVATRIGGRGGGALVLLALLHQGVVLSRVALHVSWLAKALRSARTAEAEGAQRAYGTPWRSTPISGA